MSRFRLPREIYICGAARTPIGSFLGSLSGLTASQLGSVAIKGALARAAVDPKDIDNVIMGHVLSAGCGQNTARQAALGAEIPNTVDVYNVNKVCSSGLKAVNLGAAAIAMGEHEVIVAGGMESMSRVPYTNSKVRLGGFKFGHEKFEDILISDGLWDPYNNIHMGNCGEKTAADYGITREAQDKFAVESFNRAVAAQSSGKSSLEIEPCILPNPNRSAANKTISVTADEELTKFNPAKISGLKPAFQKDGTITAANASSLNDGAAAVVLASKERAQQLGLKPIARIISFADAAVAPIDFGIAPVQSIRRALERAGNPVVSRYEINEAFSCVPLACIHDLGLDHSIVNTLGGAACIGHPIGASGARILVTLLNALPEAGSIGVAGICNGGGGSSALVIEKL